MQINFSEHFTDTYKVNVQILGKAEEIEVINKSIAAIYELQDKLEEDLNAAHQAQT